MSEYPSPTSQQHHAEAPDQVVCGIVTVSDSRTFTEDRSGDLIESLLVAAGHQVTERALVPDEPDVVAAEVRRLVDAGLGAVLVTGGTGIAPRDQTPEALAGMFTKQLPGFGELFRMLSYQEIGAAAMLSRAAAGVVDRTVVLAMPGSPAAVRLAMEQLILPELPHLASMLR